MSLNPRWIACALILAWAMAFASATAQGALELPGALEVVEESAFAGTDAIDSVVLREGVRLIRSRAFADSGLTEITLPSTIEAGGIAEDAFQNASLQTIHAVEASPAFEWALETPYTLRSGNAEFTYAIDDRACTLETWLGGGSAVTVPVDICGCPVTALGDFLFAARPALGQVTLPASVVSIAANAFDGRAEDLLICADKDSAPVAFARAHKIDYQAGTTYRALVIAQTYAGSSYYNYLPGTLNDAACMADCLSRFDGTPFEVAERVDVTADEMLAAIGETFGDAEQQDVSLFYYAGHGHDSPWNAELQGSLIGVDSGKVTPAALREAMDAIPGRKILISSSTPASAARTSLRMRGLRSMRLPAVRARRRLIPRPS